MAGINMGFNNFGDGIASQNFAFGVLIINGLLDGHFASGKLFGRILVLLEVVLCVVMNGL
jgi:hypothetical protein